MLVYFEPSFWTSGTKLGISTYCILRLKRTRAPHLRQTFTIYRRGADEKTVVDLITLKNGPAWAPLHWSVGNRDPKKMVSPFPRLFLGLALAPKTLFWIPDITMLEVGLYNLMISKSNSSRESRSSMVQRSRLQKFMLSRFFKNYRFCQWYGTTNNQVVLVDTVHGSHGFVWKWDSPKPHEVCQDIPN